MCEQIYLTVCPLRGHGSIPDHGKVFRRIIPGWSNVTCTPVWEDHWLGGLKAIRPPLKKCLRVEWRPFQSHYIHDIPIPGLRRIKKTEPISALLKYHGYFDYMHSFGTIKAVGIKELCLGKWNNCEAIFSRSSSQSVGVLLALILGSEKSIIIVCITWDSEQDRLDAVVCRSSGFDWL